VTHLLEAETIKVSGQEMETQKSSNSATRVALLQARAPARRDLGREFPSLVPTEQKDQSPTAFNLTFGTVRVGVSDGCIVRAETKACSRSVR